MRLLPFALPLPALCRWASLALILSLSACGGSDKPPPVAEPLPTTAGGFLSFTPAPTQIGDRTVAPTCSGAPGTKKDFQFWARRGSSNKVAVFFEGGGACWDSGTCSFPIYAGVPAGQPGLYKGEILPTDNPTALGGMFDLNDARNPVKDWSIVYVPYCTGDIHGGSNTASYTSALNGQPYKIEHRGADNFQVILRWMEDNFRNPEQLLVTGSSAGAYGAALHYPRVRRSFATAKAVMLADAGQGVAPASFDALRNSNWNFQLDTTVYGANAQTVPSSELVRRLAEFYPNDRMAQYTTSLDLVQMQFYDVMVNGLQGVQGTACQAWTDGMLSGLLNTQKAANFRSYLASGTTHTLMRGTTRDAQGQPLFYAEASAGVPFIDWLSGLLGTAGASNVACTNCTTLPITCPF